MLMGSLMLHISTYTACIISMMATNQKLYHLSSPENNILVDKTCSHNDISSVKFNSQDYSQNN